jgi:diguanylate cyclase (GGDEF)-like protein
MKSFPHLRALACGFRNQLIITFSVGVVLVAAASSTAITHFSSQAVRETLIEQGRHVTEMLAAQSTLALLYRSSENVQAPVEATLSFPDILGVSIHDIENNQLFVLGEIDDSSIGAHFKFSDSVLIADTEKAWYFIAPVYTEGIADEEDSPFAVNNPERERLGHVRVVMGKETLNTMENNILRTNLVVSSTLSGILLFVLLAITTRMTTPLRNLADKMRRAEGGEGTVRANLQGPRDIIDMGMAFNTMMEVLEQRESELTTARDSALKFAKTKAEFAANVSHELRTPMNGVLGMLQLLQGMELTKKQAEYVEVARKSAETQLVLIEDILDFSRIESGKLKSNPVDFYLQDILEDVMGVTSGPTQLKGLDLGYVVEKNVPTCLRGEPARIRQVIINLVSNAIKFTNKGEIAIGVCVVEEAADRIVVRFEVQDTGIGIPEEAQQRIFNAFTQVDGSTTRKYGGTGLGLAICQRMVSFLGGELYVESELGVGSTFWFEIPLQAAEHGNDRKNLRHDAFAGLRVLVVDDSTVNRKFLEKTFEAWGAHYKSAPDANTASNTLRSAAAQSRPFECVIIDELMPSISGRELARQVVEDKSITSAHIILMTTRQTEVLSELIEPGIDAVIPKPVRQSTLFDAVSTLVRPLDKAGNTAKYETRNSIVDDSIYKDKRVLVVEDNRANQQVAVGMLERLGCRAEMADNGKAALDLISRQNFDLVLMDCQMPQMDGYEATACIRNLESNRNRIPVVAMTANVREGESDKCLQAGMDDYLPKPLILAELRKKLLLWLSDNPQENVSRQSEQSKEADQAEYKDDSPLDQEIFCELRESVGKAFEKLLEIFMEDTPKYLQSLEQAVAMSDSETVAAVAHSIKGSSRNFGANRLGDISKALEDIGRSGTLKGADEVLESLFRESDRVIAALRHELGSVKSATPMNEQGSQWVLVVDDDRAMRLAMREVLEEDGYQIELASNGVEAIELCKRHMPDLVLMDAVMPKMDGFIACKTIRGKPEGKHTPVLIITALDDEHSIERAFSAGATDYIPKPVHFAVLRRRIGRLLHASRAEKHVRHLAYNDPLTGLPNRAMFMDYLGRILSDARRDEDRLAILFLDLDRFKMVNDTLGHDVGDRLLKAASDRIVHCVRSGDLVARLGGDEFTVIIDDVTSHTVAENVAEKICNSLSEPYRYLGRDMYVSASIGISVWPADGRDITTLMKHADTAMFCAKERGGRYQFYEHGMGADVRKKLELENELRYALARDELTVHYQPQMDLKTGSIVGMEALVRWEHPSRGLVPPNDFIPLAEESTLIVELGERVLRLACNQTQSWLDAGYSPLRVAVNLSSRQLMQRDLPEKVAMIVGETGLHPRYLELEITESVIMNDPDEVIPVLMELKEMGVSLAIDDFGTGYSSLNYLRRFPVDMLKIDASFVRDISTDADDKALISGIIALAKRIRLKVIAEGVETQEQKAFLSEQECDQIQGYYISKPLSAVHFEQQILKNIGQEIPLTSNISHLRQKGQI